MKCLPGGAGVEHQAYSDKTMQDYCQLRIRISRRQLLYTEPHILTSVVRGGSQHAVSASTCGTNTRWSLSARGF